MPPPFLHPVVAKAAALLSLAWLLTLTGCAKNYVVLLPDDDGSLGQVVVTTPTQTMLLDQKSQGTFIGGTRQDTFTLTDAELQKDFGAALAASPQKPTIYLLYFEAGQPTLTDASQAEMPKIRSDLAQRPGADLSVIGHSDTLGDAKANYALGLTRAQLVVDLLGSTEPVSMASHGEKNLLVKTPDDTDEPRNRRVEVIVR